MLRYFDSEGAKWTAWGWIIVGLFLFGIAFDRSVYDDLFAMPSFWVACGLFALGVCLLAYQYTRGRDISLNPLQFVGGGAVGLPLLIFVPTSAPKEAVLFKPPAVLAVGEQAKVSAIVAK